LVSGAPPSTTTGRHGRLSWRDTSTISRAPAERLGVVESIRPSAGLASAAPTLTVTSGMFSRPLDRAAVTRFVQPLAFALTSGQYAVLLMMMPASGGPPLFASSIAYSPSQLSFHQSLSMMTGLRSSTGSRPWDLSRPASSDPPHAMAASENAASTAAARRRAFTAGEPASD